MEILGYVMIALGLIGIVSNLTGSRGTTNPNPQAVNKRIGCYTVVVIIGGTLVGLSI